MPVDDSLQDAWASMQANRERHDPSQPLRGGGGGGTSGGMETRVAVLEADVKHIKAQLEKLSNVPSELATLNERTNHLPTKADLKTEVSAAVDRGSTRTQRRVAIVGGVVTIAVAIINYAPKLLGIG